MNEYLILMSLIFLPIIIGGFKVVKGWMFGLQLKHDKKHGYCMYIFLGKFGVIIGIFYER